LRRKKVKTTTYKYYNQNDYPTTPYPGPDAPKATVKSGGCGPTCAAMIVSNLTGKIVDPPAMAAYSIKHGARVAGGTDMSALTKALAADYGLTVSTANDEAALLAHLKSGGMAIANVGGDRSGYVGVFSNEGHYVVVANVLTGIPGTGPIIAVLDPGYYVGKFNVKGRTGKVSMDGNTCICSISVLGQDTANRSPSYYLFAKIKNEEDDDMIRYQKLSDIPANLRAPIETLMDAGIIVGDGSDPKGNNDVIDLSHDQVRTLVFAYRGGAFDRRLKAAGLAPVVAG
jgi:hypothetical protein